jgi:two-component system NtrC family sensor kinase
MTFLRYSFGLSLRLKFVLPISVMLIISMLIISGYLINRQSDSFRRELESNGETMIQMLAINSESGVLFESTYELGDLLDVLSSFAQVEYCLISNLEGTVLANAGLSPLDADQVAPLRDLTRSDHQLHSDYFDSRTSGEVLILAAPITTQKEVLDRETLGITGGVDKSTGARSVSETIGWIELGMSVASVHRATSDAKLAAILLATLVVITTIVMIIFIVSAITKPITELVEATDQISRGDFSTRVEIEQRDEIGHLANTFNRMTESLKQSRDEIEQYNRTLEEKIIERTEQLEEAQAQLIQSEKLSAIGQLAAGVAHELNNPLGGILGYAQFTLEKLRKNNPEDDPPKEIQSYLRYVGDIEIQARRCKTIVQNLLRFSRTSRAVEFEEVDVNRTLEETITFVEHQFRINHMDLVADLTPDLPLVRGNAGQLQQVLTNLIINAMHASEKGSTVTVHSRYSPALGEFGGTVELSIADTGHGIPKEDLKKIFEPFFTTKEVGKGTGLGLSVSYGIVKDHGGEISVKSELGEGTTFTIVLPVQKKAPEADILRETDQRQV